jgi:hypothetical protein
MCAPSAGIGEELMWRAGEGAGTERRLITAHERGEQQRMGEQANEQDEELEACSKRCFTEHGFVCIVDWLLHATSK